MALAVDDVRRIALALPGMVEGTAYGTTAFRRGKTFIARLRDEDSILALKMDMNERDMLIEAAPAVFFLTEHYRAYPYVLVRLETCEPERLARVMERAWLMAAPKASPRRKARKAKAD